MWAIFPFYMFHLVNRYWIRSAILLALIASVHNLAFLMSLSATIPYIISLLFQRSDKLKKGLLKFAVFFVIFATPAFIFFILPVITSVQGGRAAEAVYEPWPIEVVVEQLKPGLFYLGIICLALAPILNYKVLSWMSAWALIYFIVFDLSSVLGERFGRELSVVLGLVTGITIAYVLMVCILTGKKWFGQSRVEMNTIPISSGKLIIIIALSAAYYLFHICYFQDRFQQYSNPDATKYFTSKVDESNKFFLSLPEDEKNVSLSLDDKRVIALFGDNPWLKVTTYGKLDVLGVSPNQTRDMGKKDLPINTGAKSSAY